MPFSLTDFAKNSAKRFRALCIEQLRREKNHTFINSTTVLYGVNNKLSYLPEWKKHEFTERYFIVDESFIEVAIEIRNLLNKKYLYLKDVFNDERLIQSVIENLAQRPDITLTTPVTENHFYTYLKNPKSKLIQKVPEEYEKILITILKKVVKFFLLTKIFDY